MFLQKVGISMGKDSVSLAAKSRVCCLDLFCFYSSHRDTRLPRVIWSWVCHGLSPFSSSASALVSLSWHRSIYHPLRFSVLIPESWHAFCLQAQPYPELIQTCRKAILAAQTTEVCDEMCCFETPSWCAWGTLWSVPEWWLPVKS